MSLPGAAVALCSLPLFLTPGNAALILMCTLLLTACMNHQYEEHARGRFACFGNSEVGGGRDVLTSAGACLVDILGVWLLFLAFFYLAKYGAIGFAFAPVYATLINGATHAIGGAALRRYNPGSPRRSYCSSLGATLAGLLQWRCPGRPRVQRGRVSGRGGAARDHHRVHPEKTRQVLASGARQGSEAGP
jgi:hypothetical protein